MWSPKSDRARRARARQGGFPDDVAAARPIPAAVLSLGHAHGSGPRKQGQSLPVAADVGNVVAPRMKS